MNIFTVACASPKVALGNPVKNADAALESAYKALHRKASLLLLPHNQLTGETLGDARGQEILLSSALRLLTLLCENIQRSPICVATSLPVRLGLYTVDCAALLVSGEIFLHPLEEISGELPPYIMAFDRKLTVHTGGFSDASGRFVFGFEALDGRLPRAARRPYPLMLRPRANPWLIDGADDIADYAARYQVNIAQASGGLGESGADYAWRNICRVATPGGDIFEDEELLIHEADMDIGESCMMDILPLPFTAKETTAIDRYVSPEPYLDACGGHPEMALEIAATALAARLRRIAAAGSVLGISGGVDSTLALLICVRAAEIAHMHTESVLGITLPGFGTSQGTHENALRLMDALGVEMREISIVESVRVHFNDIGHDENDLDVTYENAQARERGQIIMDLANQTGRVAVGTGDMSELAMGFTTLGGDHLSMYGVMAGIPKTIAKACLSAVADQREDIRDILLRILRTPVSPELLPTENGWITQLTEEILGPYPVIDFYMYHMLYHHMSPEKLFLYARRAFGGQYDRETLLRALKTFISRFFAQQYKRNFLPEGPAVFRHSFSPRAGLKLPSDLDATIWTEQAEKLR